MARPIKRGLDYFPFDVDLFEDEKVICVAGEFGLKAEITLVKLLCAIYRNGYFIEWSDEVRMKLLHSLPGVSVGLLSQIVDSLLKWGFFCRSLFKSANVLTSEGIQRRYFEAAKFRKIDTNKLSYLLIDTPKNYSTRKVSQGLTGVSQYNNSISQEKIFNRNNVQTVPKKDENGVSQGLTPISQGLTGVSQEKIPIKEIYKDNDDKSSSSKREEAAADDLRRQVEDYKKREIWLNDMSMKFHITPDDIRKYLDEFYLDMRCREIKVQKLTGVFIPWLTDKLQKKANERSNNNNYAKNGGGVLASRIAPKPGCGLIED